MHLDLSSFSSRIYLSRRKLPASFYVEFVRLTSGQDHNSSQCAAFPCLCKESIFMPQQASAQRRTHWGVSFNIGKPLQTTGAQKAFGSTVAQAS